MTPKDRFMFVGFTISRRRMLGYSAGAAILIGLQRLTTAAAQDATPVPALGWSDEFADNGLLNVATTVAPISSIVRNIGGDRINLRGIVPDGTNSHTFEPAPSDAVILALADLVIINGLQLEQPTMELAEANLKEGAEICSLGDQTITPDEYAYDFSFPKEEGKPNPHLWVNVPFALRYAELTEAKLSQRDPTNAEYYKQN